MNRIKLAIVGWVFLVVLSTVASETSKPDDVQTQLPQWLSAQAAYTALDHFTGSWRGAGKGKWGTSIAEKTYTVILDGRARCRTGSSVYPVQERNPNGEVHKTHALFALIEDGGGLIFTEYDNEGFIARYALDLASSEANKTWVFELVSGDNLPPNFRARLTLHAPVDEHYMEIFELDFGSKGYTTYLTNRLSRVVDAAVAGGCQ